MKEKAFEALLVIALILPLALTSCDGSSQSDTPQTGEPSSKEVVLPPPPDQATQRQLELGQLELATAWGFVATFEALKANWILANKATFAAHVTAKDNQTMGDIVAKWEKYIEANPTMAQPDLYSLVVRGLISDLNGAKDTAGNNLIQEAAKLAGVTGTVDIPKVAGAIATKLIEDSIPRPDPTQPVSPTNPWQGIAGRIAAAGLLFNVAEADAINTAFSRIANRR